VANLNYWNWYTYRPPTHLYAYTVYYITNTSGQIWAIGWTRSMFITALQELHLWHYHTLLVNLYGMISYMSSNANSAHMSYWHMSLLTENQEIVGISKLCWLWHTLPKNGLTFHHLFMSMKNYLSELNTPMKNTEVAFMICDSLYRCFFKHAYYNNKGTTGTKYL